ncbi:MAG: hypothetical protein C4551_02260 [Bacillota bacterium]|nr:MAG: hypothetical protein C4551_02260 [Bacillota bacterium]
MTTLAAYRTMIEEEYQEGSSASTTIKDRFINQAYAKLYALTGNTKEYSTTTAASQLEYVLPTDFLSIKHVEWNDTRLYPVSTSWAYAQDDDWRRTTGTPSFYLVEGDRLRLVPVDSAGSKTLKIWYYGAPTSLSATTDEPDLPATCDDAIVAYACWKIARRLKDWAAAAEFERSWERGYFQARRDLSTSVRERPEQVEDHYRW